MGDSTMNDLRKRLEIPMDRLDEINQALTDPDNDLVSELLAVVESYGGPEEINRKAAEARKLENLMARLKEEKFPYLDDVQSLMEQCDKLAFVSMDEYYARVLGDSSKAAHMN
jgi:DNA-binding phage protein